MGEGTGFYPAGNRQQVNQSCKPEPVSPKDCECSSKTEEAAKGRLQEEPKVDRPTEERIIAAIKQPSAEEEKEMDAAREAAYSDEEPSKKKRKKKKRKASDEDGPPDRRGSPDGSPKLP